MANAPDGKPRIVVPDDNPPAVAGSVHEPALRALGDLRIYDSLALGPEALLERIRDAHVAICIRNSSVFSADVLERCADMRHIVVFGIGVDMVDLDACRRLGIIVTNTPGYSAAAVAEHAIALALAVARRIVTNDRIVREGGWAKDAVGQLYGKTLGVIGTGPIGKRAAELGRGLGMNVIAWTFHPDEAWGERSGVRFAPLEEVMASTDVVTVHLRLSDQSRGLLDRRLIESMKADAFFVNTARGAIADEEALQELLAAGRIGGAGLDVFSQEPLPPGHPFTALDNVVLAPHVASSTPEADTEGIGMVVDNIRQWLAGTPVHVMT
ncbi:MAG: 3-phosphoglycerate dehydrogenase [Chloroflexota bacterium]|nr:3-phosphoglycerate dehydrogenase [Chloroflexota bacterium]